MTNIGHYTICILLAGLSPVGLGEEDRRTVEDKAKDSGTKALAVGEPMVPGPFKPTYESLKAYKCPDWYQDAKLGFWAHWGPQGVAEIGDWYARDMYVEGGGTYKHHVEHYGHPSTFGYKDIIQLWKAEKFDPDRLISLYKAAGAKYFVSMGSHHDNFDLWNSKYHRWNAVNMGPKKDIVKLWRDATLKQGLRFGVSEHLAPSFKWFSVAHHADKNGPMAGVPYDGNDPANYDLYGPKPEKIWSAGAELWQESGMPDSWKLEWYRRINDLLSTYKPDYVYTDYGNVPFRREVGWQLLANYYNRSISDHGGKLEAVFSGKGDRERTYVRAFESGCAPDIRPEPWQMDKCINRFYYYKNTQKHPYLTSERVIRLLMDVVSKNGNLLLSIPQKPDGSLDAEEEAILAEMAAWMQVNSEAVFATRPFKIFGGGPTVIRDFRADWNYTADDIRFTVKSDTLYATVLGKPLGQVVIAALKKGTMFAQSEIASVQLLGYDGKLDWQQRDNGLVIQLPATADLSLIASVFKISGLKDIAYDGAIYPASDDVTTLNVASAEMHGEKFSISENHMAGWMDSSEWLSWKVKITRPGTYEIMLDSTAMAGESEVTVSAGDATLTGKFPKTGNWDDYQTASIGQLTFKESGVYTLNLKPASAATWHPLNLRNVMLKPSNKE
jgi:alpha-L-fucosidase